MAGPRKVHLTEDVARRMGAATLAYERGNRDMPPVYFRTANDADGGLRIGKTTSQWNKNTTATIAVWEAGTPPNETSSSETIADVVNHWGDVPSGKWVGVQAAANGHYYLVVAEC